MSNMDIFYGRTPGGPTQQGGEPLAGLNQMTQGMTAMGTVFEQMANVKQTQGLAKTFDNVRKVKGKDSKKLGKSMDALKGAATSYGLSMLFWVLEKMGILKPVFALFGALLSLFGGNMMVAMMPLFMRLLEVMTSPEMMELNAALADLLVAILIPALTLLILVLEATIPYIHDLISALQWVTGLLDTVNTLFFGSSPGLIPALQITAQLLDLLVNIHFKLLHEGLNLMGKAFDFLGVIIKTVVGFHLKTLTNILQLFANQSKVVTNNIVKLVDSLTRLLKTIQQFSGMGAGGRMGGMPSSRGSTTSLGSIASSVRDTLGFQGGGILPHTGWFYGHEGEEVKTAADTSAKESQIDDMLNMQMESLEYQKKLYKFMKYGV